jgi:hypothetical protein
MIEIAEPGKGRGRGRTAAPETSQWSFVPAPIGAGGGFVTGVDIASDGSRMVCNTDVFNGYIREAGDAAWRHLLRQDNLPAADYDPRPAHGHVLRAKSAAGANNGSYCTRIAPSDPRTIYTAWNGLLYRSDDAGASFRRTALPPKAFLADTGPSRRFNRSIDIHPRDPARLLVGTNGDGCYASGDGFQTFQRLELPDTANDFSGTPGRYLVAWGKDGSAWVHVFGVGLYHSAAGIGGQFLFAGGPATASCLVVAADGAVYVCQFRTSATQIPDALHVLRDGTWRRAPGTLNADQVAVSPFDPLHLVWVNENGGEWWQSRDGGASSTDFGNEQRGQGESDWLSNSDKALFPAQLLFDPVREGRLWIAEGVGINYCDLPATPGRPVIVQDFNAGISEFVATCGLSAAAQATTLLGVMDKGVWQVTDTANNGWTYSPPLGRTVNTSAIAHLRSIDNALDDPDFVVGLFQQDGGNGWSEDWGRSFTAFPPPAGRPGWAPGGDCAVSTRDNILIAEGNRGGAWWTKNGGRRSEDWHPVSFGGYSPVTEWLNAYYVHRDCITADKTRPGVFAALVNNIYKLADNSDAIGRDIAGLWLNRNGGEGDWEQRIKGTIAALGSQQHSRSQFWQARLAYVPGHSGELLYANCEGSNRYDQLLWLQDDGARVRGLPAYRLSAFDFGMPAPGSTRPAVYFYGLSGGIQGLFVSFDWFATKPLLISRFPNNSIDNVAIGLGLVADMHRFGRCYLGFGGNGWVRADLQGGAAAALATQSPHFAAMPAVEQARA